MRVCKFAIKYWKIFKKDLLIDMIGFRKHGHNEVDEPAFTQPHMYEKIRATKSLAQTYADRLIKDGVITRDQIEKLIG